MLARRWLSLGPGEELWRILRSLDGPGVVAAFAYGSGAFSQPGYAKVLCFSLAPLFRPVCFLNLMGVLLLCALFSLSLSLSLPLSLSLSALWS